MIMTLLLAGALSLSDPLALEFVDADQTVAQLKYLAAYSTDWPDAADWTEKDSGGKVNLAGGVWSIDGDGGWNHNGIYKTTGHTTALGYMQADVCWPATRFADAILGLNNAADLGTETYAPFLDFLTATTWGIFWPNAALGINGNTFNAIGYITPGVWYTVRVYPLKNSAGAFKRLRYTLQGGAEYPTETTILEAEFTTALAATLYPHFQRLDASAGNLVQVRRYRWFSGYSLAGPYGQADEDAGVNRAWRGDELTAAIAAATMPAGIATTNLTFQYSWDDGVAAWSGVLTFAAYKAVVLAGRRRYFRTRVIANSDGVTQVPLTMPLVDARISRPGTVMPTWGGGEVSGIH